MATRARIGKRLTDGAVVSIYSHWDGYLEGVGDLLVNYYNTEEKVDELLNLGDISSLRERIKPNADEIHNFDFPLDDVTIAYGRDRGEKDTFARFSSSPHAYVNKLGEEYNYLFMDGDWYFAVCEENVNEMTDEYTMTIRWELVRDWIGKDVY